MDDYMPPGRVVKIGHDRYPRFCIRDSLGRFWSGEERRWSDVPSAALLFHTEVSATEERNRCCLGGDEADTFTVTVVLTVHARRWSLKELARHLKRHQRFFIGGPAGKEGLLMEVLYKTLKKIEP